MRRLATVILFIGLALPAGSAVAAQGGPDPIAVAVCKAQGLPPQTGAFKQCVKQQPGRGVPKQLAAKTCRAAGLDPKTDAFKRCVKRQSG